jgi:hypothetical protein
MGPLYLTSAPVQKNLFRLSQLTSIVEKGLRKPIAKLESGMNLVMYDVYWLAMMMLFTGSKYLE